MWCDCESAHKIQHTYIQNNSLKNIYPGGYTRTTENHIVPLMSQRNITHARNGGT